MHYRAHWRDNGTSLTFCNKLLPDNSCVMNKKDVTCTDCLYKFYRLFYPTQAP